MTPRESAQVEAERTFDAFMLWTKRVTMYSIFFLLCLSKYSNDLIFVVILIVFSGLLQVLNQCTCRVLQSGLYFIYKNCTDMTYTDRRTDAFTILLKKHKT